MTSILAADNKGIAVGDVVAAHQLGGVEPWIVIRAKVFKGIGADMVVPQAAERDAGEEHGFRSGEQRQGAVDPRDFQVPR